jgi:hypothetical protein
MQSCLPVRLARLSLAIGAGLVAISGCTTPSRLAPDQLASMGLTEGTMYWKGEEKLAQAGYRCYVSGAKRERFDCTRQTGFFPRACFESNSRLTTRTGYRMCERPIQRVLARHEHDAS